MTFQDAVARELKKARENHDEIQSAHEGLAVILEEFDELKTVIFAQNPDYRKMLSETVQIAAMCQRFAEDVIECSYTQSR